MRRGRPVLPPIANYYYDSTTGLASYTNSAAMSSGTTFFRLLRLDPLAYP